MKKTIVLFLFSLTLLFSSLYNLKANADGNSINNLSYSKSDNLLDPSTIRITNGNLSLSKNIYASYTDDMLTIRLKQSKSNGQAVLIYYDIDFNEIGRSIVTSDGPTVIDDVTYDVLLGYIPEDTFSFNVVVAVSASTYIEADFSDMMIYFGEDELDYTPFVKANGFFDLTDTTPVITVEYNANLTLPVIKNMVHAFDGYNGNLDDKIVINATNYLDDTTSLGLKEIYVSVKDNSNNESTGTFKINVVDRIAPVIQGSDVFNWPVNTALSNSNIIERYTCSDGHDGTIEEISIDGSFSATSATVKTEQITLKASDKSGNIGSKVITINFYDDIKPIFTSDSTLVQSYTIKQSVNDIKNNFITVSDNVDTNIKVDVVSDNYTENIGKVGSYEIVFKATDLSNNSANFTLTVNIVDGVAPIIYFDSFYIETLTNITVDAESITSMLYETGELSRKRRYTVYTLVDTYTPNKETPGVYTLSFRFMDEQNEIIDKSFLINVTEDAYTVIEYKRNNQFMSVEFISLAITSFVVVSGLIFIIIYQKKHYNSANS